MQITEENINYATLKEIQSIIPTVRYIRKRGLLIAATTPSGTVRINADIMPQRGTYDFKVPNELVQ